MRSECPSADVWLIIRHKRLQMRYVAAGLELIFVPALPDNGPLVWLDRGPRLLGSVTPSTTTYN